MTETIEADAFRIWLAGMEPLCDHSGLQFASDFPRSRRICFQCACRIGAVEKAMAERVCACGRYAPGCAVASVEQAAVPGDPVEFRDDILVILRACPSCVAEVER